MLAELGEQGQQGATRWERFKRWLKQKLENRKDDDEPGWLEKWSRQFRTSEGVAQPSRTWAMPWSAAGAVRDLAGTAGRGTLAACGARPAQRTRRPNGGGA